tara:strand:- start:2632 stop:2964 length:333 start_codon:yes stop_codon:yes gene_type:complete
MSIVFFISCKFYILYKEQPNENNFRNLLTSSYDPVRIDLSNRKGVIEMALTYEQIKLLAEQSVRDGEQRYTEAQIRDMVGAPTIEEEETCICGEPLEDCPEGYEHMTMGY